MLPRFTACIAPFEPHNTSSSAGGSLTIVRIKSAALAASWGDFASFAPAATSSSAREAVRFQTVREWPALMRFMPMGRPIRPRPISPIFLEAAADSKECLLESDVREARRCCLRKEETIVAELRGGSSADRESKTDWIRRQKRRGSDAGGKILQGGQPFIEFPTEQFEIDGF